MPYLFIILFLLLTCHGVTAQENRTLSLDIDLDVGVVDRPLDLEITVNNHGFVFLLPATILRPLISQRSTRVQLPAGATSISAFVDEIMLDPADYVVEINCLGCSDTVPQQYFRPEGNVTGLIPSAFINPEDLPPQIDVSLITRAQFTGQIRLLAGQVAERDLVFEIGVFNASSSFEIQNQRVTLNAGENEVSYLFRGLSRSSSTQLEVRASCMACGSVLPRSQTFDELLSTQIDSSDIDFEFDIQTQFFLNGVFEIILVEP